MRLSGRLACSTEEMEVVREAAEEGPWKREPCQEQAHISPNP